MRHGTGNPVKITGDTCDSYYIDVLNANIWAFDCVLGGWLYRGGGYTNKIKGGTTVHVTSDTITIGPEAPPGSGANLNPIKGLTYTVTTPPGRAAYGWVRAWGACRKSSVNNDYMYAKFDIEVNGVKMDNWQEVSMGPNGPAPDSIYDNVRWSIAGAVEVTNGATIEIVGGQRMRGISGLGSIVLADKAGTDNVAHMEIMLVYSK